MLPLKAGRSGIKSNKISNFQFIVFINQVNAIDNSLGATKFEN